MGHGWEFVSFGFPALPAERERWGHLPRLVLADGTVLSRERWTLDQDAVRELVALTGFQRYLAWRAEAERLGLPALVHVRCRSEEPDLLLQTESPLAIRCLFDTLAVDAPWMVISELPGTPEDWPLVDDAGQHHLAELGVTWVADNYWSVLVSPEGGGDAAG
jgi:hypothetical protein